VPPVINIRPAAINLLYYPGSPITLTFTFPAGYLATVTFKTFLNGRGDAGVEGVCTEDDDVLTVTFDEDDTNGYDFPVTWELDLFTSGDPDVYLPQFVGIWSPGTDGNDGPVNSDFTVEIPAEIEITVSSANIPGAPGSPAAPGADGVVQAVVEGTNVTVDATDPANPIVSATGLALADGDYGDITASSSGAVLTIDNGVVTLAKQADLAEARIIGRAAAAGTGVPTALTPAQSKTLLAIVAADVAFAATARFLGRTTAGAGAGEELTAAQVKALLDYAASEVAFTPAGGLSSTDVQAAIEEAAALPGATFTFTLNAQTGTTFTPALTDLNKLVTLNNASPVTVTLPQNSDVGFAIGTPINFQQIGAGQVTFAAGAGATVTSTPGLNLRDQYSLATAIKVGTDAWTIIGDLDT
jgi:hypothetical protein